MRLLANFNYPGIQMAFPIQNERQLIYNRKLWDYVSFLSVCLSDYWYMSYRIGYWLSGSNPTIKIIGMSREQFK